MHPKTGAHFSGAWSILANVFGLIIALKDIFSIIILATQPNTDYQAGIMFRGIAQLVERRSPKP